MRIVSNIGILKAYAVIYIKLDSCYFQRSKTQMMDIETQELTLLKKSQRSLMILFLSITQLYIFRMIRGSLAATDLLKFDDPSFWDVLFTLSKTLFIVGLCLSIYKRVSAQISLQIVRKETSAGFSVDF